MVVLSQYYDTQARDTYTGVHIAGHIGILAATKMVGVNQNKSCDAFRRLPVRLSDIVLRWNCLLSHYAYN